MSKSKITLAVNADKKNLREAVTQAIADLDTIIANIDTATAAEVRTAIKKLAQHQKKIIRRLAQL